MGRLTIVAANDDGRTLAAPSGLSFGDAIDGAPLPCLRIDARGVVEAANPAACDLLGLSVHRRGMPVLSAYVNAKDLGRFFQFVRDVHSSLEPMRTTVRVRSSEGSEFDVQLDGRQLTGHETSCALISMVDVTEQRRAVAQLSESERRLRELLEMLPDAVFAVRDNVIVQANPAACNLVGVDVVGTSFSELLCEEQRSVAATWSPSLVDRDPRRRELYFAGPDGSRRVAEAVWSTISLDGQPALLCVARDCTGQRHVDANLAHRDRLATVGMLAAGVAHEINNPLTYISMNLAELSRTLEGAQGGLDEDDAAELAVSARDALDGAQRIARIVGDLQGISRVDDELGPVDVNAVVERVLNLVMPHTIQGADVLARLGHVEPALADDGRMVQVVLNLVMNAVQAAPSQGGRIEISTSTTRDGVQIRVRDNGPGIAPSMLHRLFEPFTTTKGVGEGSGLGLYVCHRYVTACGGHIEVLSPASGGTEFRVQLRPCIGESNGVDEFDDFTMPPPRSTTRSSILVVEDEPAIARSIGQALERNGDVDIVATAQEAITAIESHEATYYDAVLCDLALPGGSGRQVLQHMEETMPDRVHRFGLMTGGAVESEDADFLATQSVPCLRKPFTLYELTMFVTERTAAPSDDASESSG